MRGRLAKAARATARQFANPQVPQDLLGDERTAKIHYRVTDEYTTRDGVDHVNVRMVKRGYHDAPPRGTKVQRVLGTVTAVRHPDSERRIYQGLKRYMTRGY